MIREFGGASREIRSASRQLRNAGWSRGRKMCASHRCPTVTTLVCALPHSWAGLAQKDWEGATATAGKINGIRNGTWHTPQVPQCGSCVICAGRQLLSRSCRTRRRAAAPQQALRRKTGKERPRRRRSGYVMPVTLSGGKINGVRNGTGTRQVPSVRRVAMRALSNLGPASSTLRAGSLMRALAVHKTWVTAPKHVERNERNNKKPARCRSCSAQECGSHHRPE